MLKHIERIGSTQKEVKSGIYKHLEGVYTFDQTEGFGRRGTRWESKPDTTMAFSFIYGKDSEAALSIKLGIELTKIFDEIGFEVKLKWPNDLYYKGKKFCGILVERIHKKDLVYHVVGIGFNIAENEYGHLPITKEKALEVSNKILAMDFEAEIDTIYYRKINYLADYVITHDGIDYDENYLNTDGSLEVGSGEVKKALYTDSKTKLKFKQK